MLNEKRKEVDHMMLHLTDVIPYGYVPPEKLINTDLSLDIPLCSFQ